MNNQIEVWSLKTRVFHTLIVFSVFVAFLTEDFEKIHQIAGYTILFLLIFRIYYSFRNGNKFEKLSQFFHSPKAISSFLFSVLKLKEERYLGHNPLAGIVMFSILIVLLLSFVSGSLGWALKDGEGLLSLFISIDFKVGEELLNIHENLTDLLLILVGFHLIGVVVSSILTGENLARVIFKDGLKRIKDE
jgi:cytochrome b